MIVLRMIFQFNKALNVTIYFSLWNNIQATVFLAFENYYT